VDAEHQQVATNGWMLRRQLEEICNDAVQNQISALIGSEEAPRSHGGQYGNLLRKMSQAALECALANNIGPSDFKIEVLWNALALVEGLRYAFINDPSNRSPNFLDDGNPIDLIKADKVPRFKIQIAFPEMFPSPRWVGVTSVGALNLMAARHRCISPQRLGWKQWLDNVMRWMESQKPR
jgi:hypothetical protein